MVEVRGAEAGAGSTPSIAPGPRGHFLLGSLPEMSRDCLGLLLNAPLEFGDVVRLRLGPSTAHLLRRPDHVRHVLLDNYQNYDKKTFGFQALKRSMGEGLLTSEGAFWLRQRRIAQPAFHKQFIEGFGSIMTAEGERLVERLGAFAAAGERFDLSEVLLRSGARIAGETLLGADISEDVDAIGDAVTCVLHDANLRLTKLMPAPDFIPTAHNRRFRAALELLDRIVFGVIEKRRRDPKGSDLLGMLMAARDEETGEGMSDRQLRDEVMTIFLSGHETTAGALTWTFYLLGKHPNVLERLRGDLAQTLGDRAPTVADLPSLPYLTMVLQESMRLYPPAWMITRRAKEQDVIGGYGIPKGSFVFVSPMVTHRHSEYWPDPEAFDPQRFKPEAFARLPKFAYYPFGGGPRGCIGSAFAMMEAQLILATVLPRFELNLVPEHPVALEPLISLRPRHGMLMTARALSRTAAS